MIARSATFVTRCGEPGQASHHGVNRDVGVDTVTHQTVQAFQVGDEDLRLALHFSNQGAIGSCDGEIRDGAGERGSPVVHLIDRGLPAYLRIGNRNLRRSSHQRLAQLRQLRGDDQGGQISIGDLVKAGGKSGDCENGDAALRDRKQTYECKPHQYGKRHPVAANPVHWATLPECGSTLHPGKNCNASRRDCGSC